VFDRIRKAFTSIVEKLSKAELSEDVIDRYYEELLFDLTESDVALPVAEEILNRLKAEIKGIKVNRFSDRKRILKEKLKGILIDLLSSPNSLDLVELARRKKQLGEPLTILFLGPNGHGKTTTIAKVAYMFKSKGFKVIIAAADTFRAGAIEQLEEHARKLGVKLIKHGYRADPAAVAYDAVNHAKSRGIDVVLIDTAGRMQTDVDLMNEMRKIVRVVKPDAKIFVGDALTGNDALDEAKKFNEAVGIDASILTKLDADAKGGAALSIVYATSKPLIFVGTGQGYGDLEVADPGKLAKRILGEVNG